MAQNGPIADHTAEGVPLTSTLRDSVVAYAGETVMLRKASAPSAAIRVNAEIFGLVISLFIGILLLVLKCGLGLAAGRWARSIETNRCPSSCQLQGHRQAPPVQELNPGQYRN
jgi:hypothetical protein